MGDVECVSWEKDISWLRADHFLQRVRRAYGIVEGVVVRVNSSHGDVGVSLDVTDCGNLCR
jgi:hypothetical protein